MPILPLVAYNHHLRARFAAFFEEQPWSVLVEDHGASHHSIANVFMHGCNMEDWYLHSVLPGKPWTGPKYDGFTSAAQMSARVAEVEAKTRPLLDGASAHDLARVHDLDLGGEPRKATLEELLTEVVVEDLHHRGEILAMLWRKDIPPPYVSYVDWAHDAGRA